MGLFKGVPLVGITKKLNEFTGKSCMIRLGHIDDNGTFHSSNGTEINNLNVTVDSAKIALLEGKDNILELSIKEIDCKKSTISKTHVTIKMDDGMLAVSVQLLE